MERSEGRCVDGPGKRAHQHGLRLGFAERLPNLTQYGHFAVFTDTDLRDAVYASVGDTRHRLGS